MGDNNQKKYVSNGCFVYGFYFIIALFFGVLVTSSPIGGLVFGVIACVIAFVIDKNKKEAFDKKVKEMDNKEKSVLQDESITQTVVYKYENVDSINDVMKNVIYIVDEPLGCVLVFQNNELTRIPFTEILDCKIYEDSEVAGGIGRAIVGGALAGEAGAIVGATTAKKHVSSYKISIIRSNITHPQTSLILIDKQISTQSNNFKSALEFAQNVYASVMAIIANGQK